MSSVDEPQPPKKMKLTSGASGNARKLFLEDIAKRIAQPGGGRAVPRGASSSKQLRTYGEF